MAPLLNTDTFFYMVRERYSIKLRRDAKVPWPWTNDKVFQDWRFTNVFREDDKTTTWFRENVRKHLTGLDVVRATVIFRWFNRISTGEIIKDLLLDKWDTEEARRRLDDVRPVVTGAYMIKTYTDMNKLDGILLAIDRGIVVLPPMVPRWGTSLEQAWKDLQHIHFMGGFMAHEIVQDLRYTPVLENAKDLNTWSHLGPGAVRGMSWILHDCEDALTASPKSQKMMIENMRVMLELSREEKNWPQDWPWWELHQVEFALCEYSKYMKAKRGIPQKRRYSQEI